MYTVIYWNTRKVVTSGETEANRMARTLIHFGARNVAIDRLSFDEITAVLNGKSLIPAPIASNS